MVLLVETNHKKEWLIFPQFDFQAGQRFSLPSQHMKGMTPWGVWAMLPGGLCSKTESG